MAFYKIIPIESDGNCLFRCLSWVVYGSQDSHMEIRHNVIDETMNHWQEFKNFIIEDEVLISGFPEPIVIESQEHYKKIMSHNGAFGGEVEILNFTTAFNISIELHVGEVGRQIRRYNASNGDKNCTLLLTGSRWTAHYQIIQFDNADHTSLTCAQPLNTLLTTSKTCVTKKKRQVKRANSNAQKCKNYRKRQKTKKIAESLLNLQHPQQDLSTNNQHPKRKKQKTQNSNADTEYDVLFRQNSFGHTCNICDRLWFRTDLVKISKTATKILQDTFPDEDINKFLACRTCFNSLQKNRIPNLSRSNGFKYPDIPDLPKLNCISERLISPRLPFMQIRQFKYHTHSKRIIGQIINVPVDVNNMVCKLPRHLSDDQSINVNIKRNLVHKSTYLQGHVKKATIKTWLNYLMTTPLYKLYKITVDRVFFDNVSMESSDLYSIEEATEESEGEYLLAQQQTLIWSEDKYLDIAPGQNSSPVSLLFDKHAEELSFPSIYGGYARSFNPQLNVSWYMMATSEIRRTDRRGVSPEHILYMAMKILRLRVNQAVFASFVVNGNTKQITKAKLEEKGFIQKCIDNNLLHFKSIPNSIHYWSQRKKDLFGMIRQLGKPTMFLTLSSSETQWKDLLEILYKLKNNGAVFEGNILEELSALQKSMLVNEDPVTCVLYFDKMVNVIMRILQSPACSPFGDYYVLDFFKRIEFQHRGSAHAHILLWLKNDPKENISEDMPKTIRLIEELCTIHSDNDMILKNQTHKHTFTCFKKNRKTCRFGIPFWPMTTTKILLPLSKNHSQRKNLKMKFTEVRKNLESKFYTNLEDFYNDNKIFSGNYYYDIIRSGLVRPQVFLKRSLQEIWINGFNPWIGNVLNSNMDFQFILEEFSCASYVVEYVNKTNRGISNLHKQLIELKEYNPDADYVELLKTASMNMLNGIEMSAQEAAWLLLGLSMSKSSRSIVYIPTVWPNDRKAVKKSSKQMKAEKLPDNSKNIWKLNIIQKYENRPEQLCHVCLAEFASHYYEKQNGDYGKRKIPKIIRYRIFDKTDVANYKREMVTLYYPFKNEELDILDRSVFLKIYDANTTQILNMRKNFEDKIDIDKIMEYCKELCSDFEDETITKEQEEYEQSKKIDIDFFDSLNKKTNKLDHIPTKKVEAVIRKRENVLSKEDYCYNMRIMNERQRFLVLELIHRIHDPHSEPLQVYLTGPAGTGKTFTLKMLMETCNRFTSEHNSIFNAYLACASTAKAATIFNGTTIHSAFGIPTKKTFNEFFTPEKLHIYQSCFNNIKMVLIDEISMMSSEILTLVHVRLQQITRNFTNPFGGFHIIFCGDLRQLPPVGGSPVYTRCNNMFGNELIWQSLSYYPLETIMRQTDIAFSTILTKIGNGQDLSIQETTLIESRFISEQEADLQYPDAIRLFYTKNEVTAYNIKVLSKDSDVLQCLAKDEYSGHKTKSELANMRASVHKKHAADTSGLPYLIRLSIDRPYMITTNIDITDGLVNGAIGKLIEIESDKHGKITTLWLQFPSEITGRLARSKHAAKNGKILRTSKINLQITPIYQRQTNIFSKDRAVKCTRTQFPLIEANALTVHKSQGGTFDQVIYYYNARHSQQLVYVALSRVTDISGLFLVNATNTQTFCHNQVNENKPLKTEFQRLQRYPLPTLAIDCKNMIATTCELNISIIFMNVQSLQAHKLDILKDEILSSSKYLALTETWTRNSESFNLEGYQCLAHNIRKNKRAGGSAVFTKTDNNVISCSSSFITDVADFTIVKITESIATFILAVIYISPNTPKSSIKECLLQICSYYPQENLLIYGDFNIDVNKLEHSNFFNFMSENFSLILQTDINVPTTLNNSCLDLVFSRGISIKLKHYVSYFSYHRPIIGIISM